MLCNAYRHTKQISVNNKKRRSRSMTVAPLLYNGYYRLGKRFCQFEKMPIYEQYSHCTNFIHILTHEAGFFKKDNNIIIQK